MSGDLSQRGHLDRVKEKLLLISDPVPVLQLNPSGTSNWLLLCDHAGNAVPSRLGGLGLTPADLRDHIAIDVGIWEVTQRVSNALNAEAIGQIYSRLVVDSNRRPGTPASIPETSSRCTVPANLELTEDNKAARIAEIFAPYHCAISETIAKRSQGNARFMICSLHSFIRELEGVRRIVDIGIIHGPDGTLADRLLARLTVEKGLNVDRNVPYQIDFAGDYTLPVHAEQRGIPYVEIEICQELIAAQAGQERIANLLFLALRAVSQENRL